MFIYDPTLCLPSSEELPDSDDRPVDNELQDLMPGLLKMILAWVWKDRWDWFFGVDMGIYYHPDLPAIVPDGFLSLGVDRFIDEELRLSYVLWEERRVPIFVLEVVSRKYRGEYSRKKALYAEMGVRYYAVYSSQRRRKPRLEIYELEGEEYRLLPPQPAGQPTWLAEVGLGLGRNRGRYLGIEREWLYWYDESGQRLLTPEEQAEQQLQRAEQATQRAEQEAQRAEQEAQRAEQEAQRAEQEAQRAEQITQRAEQEAQRAKQAERQLQTLREQLRQRGIDPDSLL